MTLEKMSSISLGIDKIQEFLHEYRPEKKWDIVVCPVNDPKEMFNDWTISYHGILSGEDYIFIIQDNHLLYAINITGDSVLCALSDLMKLLVEKF